MPRVGLEPTDLSDRFYRPARYQLRFTVTFVRTLVVMFVDVFGVLIVGVTGFEPVAPCSRNRCATKLRYTPKLLPCFRELLCCVEVSAASSPSHLPHWVMGDGSGPGLSWT